MSPPEDPNAPRWHLKPLQIEGLPSSVVIDADGVTLGRDPNNTVVLDSQRYPVVSSHHARVVLREGVVYVEDLGSKNGTLVAGIEVHKQPLRHGDVIELGAGGPRFAVLGAVDLSETAHLERPVRRPFGAETVRQLRASLGLGGEALKEVLERRSRRHYGALALLAALLVGVSGLTYHLLTRKSDDAVRSFEARTRELENLLQQRLQSAQAQIEVQQQLWETQQDKILAVEARWNQQRRQLEDERQELETRIETLAEDEESASRELAELRTQLGSTLESLSRFDPINVETAKLERVGEVERAVVLVEATQRFREPGTRRTLFFSRDAGGEIAPNLHGEGREFITRGSGSGFCLTDQGWIVTNAHVVHLKDEEQTIELASNLVLQSEVEVEVVFSGDSRRRPAKIIRWASEADEDLALLKIEPFEGMPYLSAMDPALPPPDRGADVFLIGFPLGRQTIRQDTVVTASTFRGIVSRVLPDYLQVDAAVHPGASGGPLIDGQGRLRGIVVGMQPVDDVAGSSAIGYIIPVAKMSGIWPPPESSP